ncbi:MAG: hypothetical protein QOD77_1116 [Thermoplasmata archaeon]|jgi:hypothetical protein|nr:hypothetical protein [Thermoplasmata archaeon]
MTSIHNDQFYGAKVPRKPPFLIHNARQPWRLGLWMFLAGFVSVFVSQANPLYQIVLGAPIFEELLKAGLTLLLVGGWTRGVWGLAVRLVAGFAVGGGFGVLEHYFSYWDEPDAMLWFRVVFHGASTTLSMLTLHVLSASRRPVVRWLATAPSTAVHYLHNTSAVLLLLLGASSGRDFAVLDLILLFLSPGLLLAGHLMVPASADPLRAAAEGWAARHLGAAAQADAPGVPAGWAPPAGPGATRPPGPPQAGPAPRAGPSRPPPRAPPGP